MGRAPCCDKTNVKRGPWSPDEDATLKNYLEKHGTAGNWIALPHKAGLKRCGKSCRLRWLNYLRPDIKHGGFTEEEDNIIFTLYNSMGSRWSVIASQLPGRTDNDVKNYWNTKLKKKLLTGQINAKNNNINDTTTNTTRKANLAEFSSLPTNPKIESYNLDGNSTSLDASCSTTLPPLMDMGYQQPYCNVQRLILDRSDQLPLTSPMEVPNFGTITQCNSYSTANIASSQEISGLSMENSHVSCSVDGSMIQDEGILLDFGFDQSPYELLKGFGF